MEDNTFSLCDEVKVSSEGLGRWVVKPNMSRIPGPDGFTMPLLPTTHLQLGWFNLDFLVSRFSPELSRWSQVFFSQSTSAKRRKGWLALVIAVSCYKKKDTKFKSRMTVWAMSPFCSNDFLARGPHCERILTFWSSKQSLSPQPRLPEGH